MYNYSSKELTIIDQQLDPILVQAAKHGVETQQLALDATRLLSCTEDRLEEYKDKGFFKRCWSKLSGKTGSMVRANQNDLIGMQKVSWRYLTVLQERDLMLAHSIIAVKNNLLTLAVKEEETRRSIIELADRISLRFTALEDRVDRLEVATGLHGWLLTLSAYDYDERFPPYIRLLRVVRDFYRLKPSDWTLQEIKYLQKAVDEVGLDGKSRITIGKFIDGIIDELDDVSIGIFRSLVCLPADDSGSLIPSKFVLEEIAVPFYASLARIEEDYENSMRTIRVLAKQLSLSPGEAHKQTLMAFVEEDGIDITVAIPLRDLAVELLACMGMTEQLYRKTPISNNSLFEKIEEAMIVAQGDLSQELNNISTQMVSDCQKLADAGNASAQKFIGDFYYKGIHRFINRKLASVLYKKAADQGLAKARFSLGLCYFTGNGVFKNIDKAFSLIRLAASQEDTDAQFFLGEAYQYGNGVGRNNRTAQDWYHRAFNNGCEEANDKIGT